MSTYKKWAHGAKNKPDEFISAVDHALRLVLSHKRLWVSAALALLVGVVGTAVSLQVIKSNRREAIASKLELAKTDPKIYEEVAEKYVPFLKPVVDLSRAEVAWQKGDAQAALKILDDVIAAGSGIAGDYPLYLKAQILEKEGKKEEAVALYRKLAESEKGEFKSRAMARLALLQ
ncbi:MAG: hypothetical protein Q7T11_06440 [Deltaproteobacteria bacterium]|nr:hypothetical protein [Deltaproteobacteria bacterium]